MSRIEPIKDDAVKAGQPLYIAVRQAVRAAIDAGRFAPGERLPSTKALSDEMDVSLVTMHRAMQDLVASGVLRRGQGKGTFVHEQYGESGRPGLLCRFGLVFHAESSLADSYHSQILEGVRQRSNELGIDLVLLRFGEDWRRECQGYLYVNPLQTQLERSARARRTRQIENAPPVVVVGATFNLPNVTSYDTDNVGIGRAAVRHFVAKGHRRIAFVGGSGSVSNDRDRFEGFAEACREAGIPVSGRHILRAPGWRLDDRGREAVAMMFREPDPPTAIFAAGYYFALDCYTAAARVGCHIPADVSIVAVDDPPSAAHLSPALDTFRQPLIQLGRVAVESLFSQVSKPEDSTPESLDSGVPGTSLHIPGVHVTLEAEFIERASVQSPHRSLAPINGARRS
jgi:DNA-binding LacI/PurR family transcriptional regulator